MNQNSKYTPLKIEIERNTDIHDKIPFFITVNGKRLENVKRFYIDLDKDILFEKQGNGNTTINP